MKRTLSVPQQLALGFAALMLLYVLVSGVALYALRSVVLDSSRVLESEARSRVDVERMRVLMQSKAALTRAYLLSGNEGDLAEVASVRAAFTALAGGLQGREGVAPEHLARVLAAEETHQRAFDAVAALRRAGRPAEEWNRAFVAELRPRFQALDATLDTLAQGVETAMQRATQASADEARGARNLVLGLTLAALVLAGLVAFGVPRGLSRGVGGVMRHLQTSSTELQASAAQQATTAQEQATATHEVTTTVEELLASSREIAAGAQRVLRTAEQTAGTARQGGQTLREAQERSASTSAQVNAIVQHMVDLGTKSQQIGVILEIIEELAEQTNILSINATIEAAGAGEHGRRFAVVAEEIRKLADRVGGSAKEIRSLIDDIRGASNRTTMATEQGLKTAEAGSRRFGELTESFAAILQQAEGTALAAREIELGTRQQTTAVEQVSTAIQNVAQSAAEVEASSRQTVQIATELAHLSTQLTQVVGAQRDGTGA